MKHESNSRIITNVNQTFFTTKLKSKTMLTDDIMILRYEKPAAFTFEAGQFVQFQVPQMDAENTTDQRGYVLRSYSISSVPTDDELEFCVKVLPDGKASQYFVKLNEGANSNVSVARGVFTARTEHSTQKVFIATGAGIAPIASLIKSRLDSGDTLYLLFGLRNEKDLFWLDRFNEYAQLFPNFSYDVTLSQPSSNWTGWQGRVTEHVPALSGDVTYYLCGSVEMVKDVRYILLERGVNTKSVHIEIF